MFKPRPGLTILALPSQAFAIPFAEVTAAEMFRFADYEADRKISDSYQHIFCGAQRGPVANCPNCDRPLTQLLVLDTTDPRLHLTEWNRDLPLLFCWRCVLAHTEILGDYNEEAREEDAKRRARAAEEWYTESGRLQITRLRNADGIGFGDQIPFYYQVNADRTIRLLQYKRGPVIPDWPYPDYPDTFPEAHARLFRLTDEVQDAIRARNLGEDADYLNDEDEWPDFPDIDYILGDLKPAFYASLVWHQIGGEPWLAHGWYTMHCPLCSEPMPFLAHIQDPCTDERGFVGGRNDADVYFHTCAKCFVLGVYS